MSDISQNVLSILIAERDRLNKAIEILQGGASAPAAAPVRAAAPAPKAERKATKKKRGGKRERTPESRAAQAEKMRLYWANRKKQEAKAAK